MEKKLSFQLKTNIVLALASLVVYIIFNVKWFLFVSLLILLAATVSEKAAAKISNIWMKFAHGLGFVTNRIILGAVYYLVLTPHAFFITRKSKKHFFAKNETTYYKERDAKYSPQSLEKHW